MKLPLSFFLCTVVTMSSCSQPMERLLSLQMDNESIIFYGTYVDQNEKIVDYFYAVDGDPSLKENEKLVILEHGVIRDKYGSVLLDLSSHDPSLKGFKLFESYPTNKKYTEGIRLDPYFGSPLIGGDTFRIQWDPIKRTFQRTPLFIP